MPELTYAGFMLAAQDGCRYVKQNMRVGAANSLSKAIDRGVAGQLGAWLTVKTERSEIDATITLRNIKEYNVNGIMQVWAEKAKKYGAGNCGEQSALAFHYLRSRNVAPLDWAHFTNRDHAFVLINRPRHLVGEALRAASDRVFLCDPYFDKKGPLKQFPEYDFRWIGSLLHCEGGVTL